VKDQFIVHPGFPAVFALSPEGALLFSPPFHADDFQRFSKEDFLAGIQVADHFVLPVNDPQMAFDAPVLLVNQLVIEREFGPDERHLAHVKDIAVISFVPGQRFVRGVDLQVPAFVVRHFLAFLPACVSAPHPFFLSFSDKDSNKTGKTQEHASRLLYATSAYAAGLSQEPGPVYSIGY